MRGAWFGFAVLAGCADTETPVWALDPIWVEPSEGGDVYGFQTWELYAEPWKKKLNERYYVCSVVLELFGLERTPDPTCPACTQAWEMRPALLESDCESERAADDGWLALRGVALGAVPEDLVALDPYPGQSLGVYADYGAGWEPFGWGWPEALDTRGAAVEPVWDGAQAFVLWPAYAWSLD